MSASTWKDMKCKLAILAIFILILRYTGPASVEAATSTAHVTLSVTIPPTSQLTLDDTTLDPNIKLGRGRRILAAQNSAGATATVRGSSTPAILTVAAIDDWMTGTDADPAAAATATVKDASGNLFLAAPDARNETASHTAEGQGCSASYSETFNWYLEKSWNCDTGKRTITVIYTLTSP
ncbi:MAG: hypothetical protein WAN11_11695 [Syntrophobacteraceae bacterium]